MHRARGIGDEFSYWSRYYGHSGHLVMRVGCGEKTPHYSTIVMAEDIPSPKYPESSTMSLDEFREALLAGKVSELR